tara:strand:- start:298 stop:723 length:426 start_codon:yes stop_codon:yes gene_type:complete
VSNFHPRRAARKVVLEALFAHQFTCDNPRKTLERIIKTKQLKDNNIDFMDKLFHCVIENSDFSEKLIKSHLQNWEFGRVAQVDRLLLRMGICEIFFMENIPPKVSISEMVEISKIYSTDESPGFINGVLDAIYKENNVKED